MLNYGLVGLGNLGEKIARNLLKKKFTVKVFDKDQEKVNKLTKIGAISSLSPAEAAVDVDGLITCLPSPKISTEVMIGENGAIQKMKPGSTWIETSTTDIKDLQLVSKIAEKQNIKTIEAPVTGGVHRAEKGIITVLVGAEKKNFLVHKEAIKAFGGKIFYLGEVGSASVLKVITNMLAFANLIGSIEGLMLAKKAGLDLTTAYHAIQSSSGNSAEFKTVAPVIFNGSFDTSFSLKLACKDLTLMTSLGEDYKIPMKFTKLIEQMFINAKNKYGENEWTPNIAKDIESAVGTDIRAPNFPDKMMDYEDVVKYLNKSKT
jgi:3-hydroxyisobutyrate dehydrogenase